MSSTYRILCLSHDPAIDTGAEYGQPEPAAAAVSAGIDDHRDCDLLIGRYSYPLVEVGCPPTSGPERAGRHRCYVHSTTEWVDVAWLRLLLAVHRNGTKETHELASASKLACWPYERLRRLRAELDIDAAGPREEESR